MFSKTLKKVAIGAAALLTLGGATLSTTSAQAFPWGIPIAAGALYPTFGILLSPIVGAVAMSLSSVSVILNALRLRTLRLSAAASN